MRHPITQEKLKELLSYDRSTGVFTWAKARPKIQKGNIAGSTHPSGYIRITVGGKRYQAHRLAWLFVNGSFPDHDIDHLNHCRSDNRISNLRSVTHKENGKNQSLYSSNTSGFTGVSFDKRDKKWISQIIVDGKYICMGRFANIEDAIKERRKAEVEHGFHQNHGEVIL
jgi:hypothetical protein